MRFLWTPPTVLALLTALTAASPYPRDNLRDVGFGYLMPRACAEYCGADNEHCCEEGDTCLTLAGTATCTTGVETLAPRDWSDYTTTWTETRTYTSTISSWNGVPTTATGGTGTNGEDCVPPEGSGQIACGPICCANWQYCESNGQCALNPTAGTWSQWTTIGIITTQFSAPYRVTSGSTVIVTATPTGTAGSITATPTSTETPAPVASTNGQLSGGAIAGIVVGTIAGVILLLLLCFCCIARGLWHAFAGIFGGKKKDRKTERIEVTEERYSRRGSAYGAGGRPVHRTWFGGAGGGGRPSTAASRKEKKSGGGLGWLATGAAATAVLLGLRRSDKRKAERRSHKPPRSGSDWSSSYYTDSYTASSPSSLSSDRRTRDTRRSRQSRQSRRSRNSRGTRTSRSRPSRI